jgi:O-antigen/teichoic acid export membrane protein
VKPGRVQGWLRPALDSVLLAGGRGASMLAGFGMGMAFAHLSTQEVYGQYKYAMALLGMVGLTALPGMTVAVMRASARGDDGVLRAGMRARARASPIGVGILLVLAMVFGAWGQPALGRALAIAAICFPMLTTLELYLPFLGGRQDYLRYALFQSAVMALPVPVVVLVLLAHGRLEAAALAWLATTILLHAAFLRATARGVAFQAAADPEAVQYGRRLSPVYLVSTGQTYLSGLVVGTALGPASLAVFSIGMVWWEVLRQATSLVNLQMVPRMAAARDDDARRLLRRSLIAGFPTAVAVGGAMVLAMPMLVPALFTAHYRDSVLVAQVLVAAVALGFPGSQANSFLAARGHVRAQHWLAATAFAVEVVGLALLTMRFGVIGVAAAKCAARVWHSLFGVALVPLVRR